MVIIISILFEKFLLKNFIFYQKNCIIVSGMIGGFVKKIGENLNI